MSPTGWPRAAIFDFDGVLVQTAPCWERAYRWTLAGVGRTLEPRLLAALSGASVDGAAAELGVAAEDLRLQLSAAFRQERHALLPGARELVLELRTRSALAVATNAPEELVRGTLRDTGLLDCFELLVSAETPPNRAKPAPDVYTNACRELDVAPGDALAFEDSPVGVLAARTAGLVVVHVPSDGRPSGDADLSVANLEDPQLLAFLNGRRILGGRPRGRALLTRSPD
jgi:HAD superfamily hydrolase (TIGR01509 family)